MRLRLRPKAHAEGRTPHLLSAIAGILFSSKVKELVLSANECLFATFQCGLSVHHNIQLSGTTYQTTDHRQKISGGIFRQFFDPRVEKIFLLVYVEMVMGEDLAYKSRPAHAPFDVGGASLESEQNIIIVQIFSANGVQGREMVSQSGAEIEIV